MEKNTQIEYLRKQSNMSQEQLADLLGISRQTISEWERGISYPSVEKLLSLSRIFNVSLDYIITGKEFQANKFSVIDTRGELIQETKKSLKEEGYSFKEINLTMASNEFKKTLLSHTDSMLFGLNGKYFVSTKENSPIGNTIVVGSAGTGKTRCFEKPNISQAIKRGESLIINDVSGEILYSFKDMLQKNGYEIQYVDFCSLSTSFGFLQDIPYDSLLADKYIKLIYNNIVAPFNNAGDPFYDKMMYVVFHAAAYHIFTKYLFGSSINLYEVYKFLISHDYKNFKAILCKIPINENSEFNDYSLLSIQSDKTMEAVYNMLIIILSNYFGNIPEKSNNKIIFSDNIAGYNISDVYTKKTAVFLVPSMFATNEHSLNNMFKLYIDMLIYLLHEGHVEIKKKIFMYLDEFGNFVHPMDTLHFLLRNSYSLGMSVTVVLQSLQQIRNYYDIDNFIDFFDNIIYMGNVSQYDINKFSDILNVDFKELKFLINTNSYIKRHDEVMLVQKINDIEKIFNIN